MGVNSHKLPKLQYINYYKTVKRKFVQHIMSNYQAMRLKGIVIFTQSDKHAIKVQLEKYLFIFLC